MSMTNKMSARGLAAALEELAKFGNETASKASKLHDEWNRSEIKYTLPAAFRAALIDRGMDPERAVQYEMDLHSILNSLIGNLREIGDSGGDAVGLAIGAGSAQHVVLAAAHRANPRSRSQFVI